MASEISHGAGLQFPDDGWWESVLSEEGNEHDDHLKPDHGAQKHFPVINWDHALLLHRRDDIVTMRVTGFNRGGLLVEGEKLSGFVPCSHLVNLPVNVKEEHREECLTLYLNKELKLKIIECVPEDDRIILSERAARVAAGKRPELFTILKPGQRAQGEVTNITDFGVFVDLGGVEGLIHISELSWGRVVHPTDITKIGQEVTVLVLDVSPERCRIALSLKRIKDNPWEFAENRFPVNAVIPAVITTLVPFGAFAQVAEGLEGLIHTSEIPYSSDCSNQTSIASGQAVQVRVLHVDATRQRLGLSMKLPENGK